MSTFVSGFEGKEAKGATEYPVFSEIYSSLPVSEFHDATENLQDDDGGSVTASDDTAFSVMMDKAVESSTTEPDQRALEQKEDNAVKKQDLDLVVTANNTVTAINTVAVENEDIVVLNEDDGTRKIEEAFQENEVEVAVHNKEDATSEYFSETEKNALKAIAENVLDATEKAVQIHEVEAAAEKKDLDLVVAADNRIAVENQKISVLNEDEVTGKTEEAIQGNEVEAAVQNKEDAIAEDFNKNEKIALVLVAKAAPNEVDAPEKAVQVHEMEAVAEDQVTVEPNMVDAQEQIERAVPEAEVEAVIAAVVDYETHDAVSTELVRPEVGKQLKEIKEIVEDVLNRLNAVDALLLRN
ncbi:uncharacterized protein LOC141705851 [Apium graveolens]|uniref:uncharacterized protein LOC141705851 n=1 Tax=Apium graveolens TaxID=4045 RepID=UPI003D7A4824